MDAQLFVLKAWEQLLRCLRSDFYSYLEDLIPDLLQSARLDLPSCDFDILMEKRRACELLFRLTRQFKGMFFPWIDQVSDILIPLVKDQHVDIHKIALSAMPHLLLSAKLSIETKQDPYRTNSSLHKLVLRIVSSLLEAPHEETDGEDRVRILKSLTNCMKQWEIQQTANTIVQVLEATSKSHFSEEENVTEQEKKIIKEVVNYFRVLIKIYNESSSTSVDQFLECIKAMMEDNQTDKAKHIEL